MDCAAIIIRRPARLGKPMHTWTSEEEGIIRERFDQSYESVCRLALLFDVTPCAVSHHVTWMGLRIIRRRRWSPREEEELERLLSNHTIDEVIVLSRRSYNGVIIKAKRIKLSKNHRDGWFTQEETAKILGMSDKTVGNRIQQGILAAVPHDSTKPPRRGKSAPWHISKKALVDYIRAYPDDLQGRNVDMVLLVDILAGIKTPHHWVSSETEMEAATVQEAEEYLAQEVVSTAGRGG